MQGQTDAEMQRPSGTPITYPVSEPQSSRTSEPTTFELMRMIGDLQRTVADLAFGISAPPSTTSHAKNFMPEDPPLLGQIIIELSQPEAIPNLGNDVSATTRLCTDVATQTFGQAEVSGKNKVGTDIDPYEHLLRTVEVLKADGLNKQQVLAVVAKTVDDTFTTQNESSSNQGENREKGNCTRNNPFSSKPTLGKD
ncbi:hypothetical protein CsSME_00046090 [Camellia sinensis var. sinensis]